MAEVKSKPRGKPIKPGEHNIGRKAGEPNAVTKRIRDAIFAAGANSEHANGQGMLGYMKYMQREHPKTFGKVFGADFDFSRWMLFVAEKDPEFFAKHFASTLKAS
jgi:hypothetical protein